jgi:hypothetical protein
MAAEGIVMVTNTFLYHTRHLGFGYFMSYVEWNFFK